MADLSFANLEQTVRDGNYLTETAKINNFGSVRAVLGYAMGRFLPFATIGYGWADASYGATCPDQAAAPFGLCSRPGPRSFNSDFTMSGLAYGAGVKYAIDNHFSLGVEYVRFDFDDKTFKTGPIGPFGPGSVKVDAPIDTVKFSIDYKF